MAATKIQQVKISHTLIPFNWSVSLSREKDQQKFCDDIKKVVITLEIKGQHLFHCWDGERKIASSTIKRDNGHFYPKFVTNSHDYFLLKTFLVHTYDEQQKEMKSMDNF